MLERAKAREQEYLRQRVIEIYSERERQRQLRRMCFEIDANQQNDNYVSLLDSLDSLDSLTTN